MYVYDLSWGVHEARKRLFHITTSHSPSLHLDSKMPPKFQPNRMHLRHCLLFLHQSGLNAKEAQAKIVDTYGADAISYDTCKTWMAKFKKGDFSLQDAPRSGRPMELDLKLLQSTVEEDPYATTRELAAMLGHAQSTVESGLEKIGKVTKFGRRYF